MTVYVIGSLNQIDTINSIGEFLSDVFDKVECVRPMKDWPFSNIVSRCFDVIERSDVVYAVMKPDGTFGEGVTYEIEHARRLGKEIIPVAATWPD